MPKSDYTLMELLTVLKDVGKLAFKPTASQLAKIYKKPLAESPDGRVKVYPNGYASYCTQDGDTVVWVAGCRKYGYVDQGEYRYIPEAELLGFLWYIPVALAGEDAISENVMNRKGDRQGSRSDTRNDHDEGAEVESANWNGGTKYETPECAVLRKEQIRLMLGKLSPRQKEVIILVDKYGFSEVEVARIFTVRRKKKGIRKAYSKACVSKLLNQAKYRLGYKKIPF